MRITVVGLGYVGLVTGACLADWGHDVTGVDADPKRLGALRAGRLPFHEPGLPSMVKAGIEAGRLCFTDELSRAAAAADIVIVAVGTHDGNGGWQTDTIRTCLAQVVPAMADDATLVIRSTLPPDAVATVAGLIQAHRQAAGRAPLAALLNPEFTQEGRAVLDFQRPERVVLGILADAAHRGETALREVYAGAGAPLLVMDGIDAALTKLGSNLFLATKISFANELAELCDAFGADVTTVVSGMSLDSRIGGSFLRSGVGFGGSCLPNQVTMTIRTAAQVGVHTPLLSAVEVVNERRREQVVERAIALLDGSIAHRRIALLGLTFKPETDDLREAPALDIAANFIAAGATVVAYDPMPSARERAPGLVPGLEVVTRVEDALTDADAVVLVTEWAEFLELDWEAAGRLLARRIVIDGRNVLSGPRLAQAGFVYSSFGRGTLDPGVPESRSAAVPTMAVGAGAAGDA